MWSRMGQGYLLPFCLLLDHPAFTVLDIGSCFSSWPVWILESPSLVHPVVPTRHKITSGKSLPKCFFRVRIRVVEPLPRGSWVLSLTAGAFPMCTVLNSEDMIYRHKHLENSLRFRCSEDKVDPAGRWKIFHPLHRFLVSDWWAATLKALNRLLMCFKHGSCGQQWQSLPAVVNTRQYAPSLWQADYRFER